ncbi:MAG TPA: RIO1 family regulatory kinase/ATPase [Jatrophihabitans sp.]|nr:RIO1 family regulatory kinase/ATPase [Jatrophihabitans sp.]
MPRHDQPFPRSPHPTRPASDQPRPDQSASDQPRPDQSSSEPLLEVAAPGTVPGFAFDFQFLKDPGDGQRWSTWNAVTKGARGPEPRPSWVITSDAAVDTELGVLKTGKEADVYLIERAVPGDPDQHALLAAKRYRDREHRQFHRDAGYLEGRTVRRSRDQRAMTSRSQYGKRVLAGQWALAEFTALGQLWSLGVPVPYPIQVDGGEILMEFIGSGRAAAPRLAQVRPNAAELADYFHQVADAMRALAANGQAHGDLSPYNLLVDDGRIVLIDLPQVVDVVSNPNGMQFLQRDCRTVCSWFTARGLSCDPDELCAELIGEAYRAF